MTGITVTSLLAWMPWAVPSDVALVILLLVVLTLLICGWRMQP
jgi:hypothetical protein